MKSVILFLALMVMISGCTSSSPSPAPPEQQPAPSEHDTQNSSVVPQDYLDDALAELNQTEDLPAVHEISVTAAQWSFSPNPIEVAKGESVILHVKSADVAHGFWVPELGINKEIPAGQIVDISFTPSIAGTYTIICSVFCGDGHSGMKGSIVVTE